MLERGTGVLQDAWQEGWAVAAFSVHDLAQARAVVNAAAAAATPVIVQTGAGAFRALGRSEVAAVALAVARGAPGPVCVHLDHSRELEDVRACLRAGYSSVMFDGSDLALEDNVRTTRRVVEEAHDAGAWVEAELVGFAGDEDRSGGAAPAALTDPETAARFVERTGVDALAVAIGNVHGITAEPVRLDLARLAAIRERVHVPLVLHGASGLPDEDVRAAIGLGIAKINVNAELRRAYVATLGAPGADDDLVTRLRAAVVSMERVAVAKLAVCGGPGRPAAARTERAA